MTTDTKTESQFAVGQRVRILPNRFYPPTSKPRGIRYGIIQIKTSCPGMYVINREGATTANGEWAYCVASYRNPGAGALWFTADGLQPMKRIRPQ